VAECAFLKSLQGLLIVLTPQGKWEETHEKEEREMGVEGMGAVMAGELLLEGTGGWGEGKGHAGRR